MNPIEFGAKALELACHYQNRFCEQQEVIEMFCLDAQAALREPLSPCRLQELWNDAMHANPQSTTDAAMAYARAVQAEQGIK